MDVRANGGGNVSRMLIERLRRKLLGVNYGRTDEQGDPYPDGVFIGPMAAILDERSSSDGDIFPYMFREAGLGPLIGRRSWGGVVGISPPRAADRRRHDLRPAVGPGQHQGRVGDRRATASIPTSTWRTTRSP